MLKATAELRPFAEVEADCLHRILDLKNPVGPQCPALTEIWEKYAKTEK